MAAAAIKMDELLVQWLGSDKVYENVLNLMEQTKQERNKKNDDDEEADENAATAVAAVVVKNDAAAPESPKAVTKGIPPFYQKGRRKTRKTTLVTETTNGNTTNNNNNNNANNTGTSGGAPVRTTSFVVEEPQPWDGDICQQATKLFDELGQDPPLVSPASTGSAADDDTHNNNKARYLPLSEFVRVTKEVCGFPTFFNAPLYARILLVYNNNHTSSGMDVVTLGILQWYWKTEMEPYDSSERFFRLLKQPEANYIGRNDFLPYMKELLQDHPGLEFLSNHAEFQEKYAVTVITRIFYYINKCHSGRITLRQIRRSDLLDAFQQVDEEEDINNVTRYFSYEHFYCLYCRYWELDADRDYLITREDLLKYGDMSLSHMIVDRIFDAAPRPFASQEEKVNKEYLSYEDFIFFMLSEEDKANEVSVRYWFTCVDVDGDGKLNNMEMRAFYAVQLHRMQCMGHEIVPFEDMLCQMMDMIKPAHPEYLVVEDFLQPECVQVSGSLFDALFNLNKYLQFEQRDPFMERQKREDEFASDWDRFACSDYNRLAMEEEAREEDAMEIDWVTVDDEDDDGEEFNSMGLVGASEAPF